MNFYAFRQYTLITILAVALSACQSGSGSGPGACINISGGSMSLTITSPASGGYFETPDEKLTLAGTASSDMGISQVSWVNDRGGAGVANGTASWQTASIDLKLGENKITVAAEDTAAATTSRCIVVNRQSGQTGSATLSWTTPTERTDGSPLTNLAGYKIFYGRMSSIYDYQIDINNPGILTYVVENLVSGDWYFALTAYDSEGLESDRSNEVLKVIS
jgi:Glucodextranase, domain B